MARRPGDEGARGILRGDQAIGLDEETLKAIAGITRAEYFYAGNAADLHKVFQTLGSKIVLQSKETEVTALLAAAAAVLALAAGALSMLWFNRIL
jgi:Ca-activated chloride channel family protein